ncbi:RNA polymerase sigma factor [Marilutibacter chinensis]|uniref:RNA polymerase sigma factor n=1 Tax=Marilutibacter chinensis TaxID=2912247 RepID=A0ABS9HSF1_9GAMM|nr:RNA polymerase sigma factor [Lysobacter chinensis]MCF7221223.1 RNA polymerase sigma factor [Lysobacter chinensis]MCF7223036.1 RNA polymerase sigma factor [Lysobacter chinensis]
MSDHEINRRIDAIWRMESARVIATLARMLRDVGLAEDLAQDALVAALEKWPSDGIPDNPGAWLTTTARRRAIDRIRHGQMADLKHLQIAHELEHEQETRHDAELATLDDPIGDDLLRLIFVACHPVLSREARLALTLRLLGGLTTAEIARAFLATEPTIAQRIVRAKRSLSEADVEFEVPRGDELGERLASVLEVIYLIFNEGYSATAGDDLIRPALCEEALRLGRILAGLMPAEDEVHGLVALMEIQASRSHARTNSDGEPVLLLEQERSRWDRLLIQRGLAALEQAERIAAARNIERGPYTLQAAIAACHARALTAEATDWATISSLYAQLARLAPSPVVELNRAVAIAMHAGPAAGLDHADTLVGEPSLRHYHLLPSVRGDLLFRLGRHDEARGEFERAAELTRNSRERALLLARAARCGRDG